MSCDEVTSRLIGATGEQLPCEGEVSLTRGAEAEGRRLGGGGFERGEEVGGEEDGGAAGEDPVEAAGVEIGVEVGAAIRKDGEAVIGVGPRPAAALAADRSAVRFFWIFPLTCVI